MERRSPLFFEKDGDFNPGWSLFLAFAGLGVLACVGGIVVAVTQDGAFAVLGLVFGFLAFGMLCCAIMVVPIARAKLLATLKGSATPGSGGLGFGYGSTSYYGGPSPDYSRPVGLPTDGSTGFEEEGDEP